MVEDLTTHYSIAWGNFVYHRDAIHPTQFTWGRMFGLAWRGDKDYVYPNNLETVTHIMRHSARKQLAMAHQEMAKAQKMASAFRQRLAAAQRLAGAQKH